MEGEPGEADVSAAGSDAAEIRVGDTFLRARVHRPDEPGVRAAVVLAPGFGATRAALDRYADRFRESGLVVVSFDYRHFGESGGEPRQLLSIGRQVEDWHAAVAFTRSLDAVDPERIGLWGTSFSGGHVVRVAAQDPRLAAVVAQVPFADGIATTLRLPFVSALKAGLLGIADLASRFVGGRPVTMPLVARPGRAAAMALDEAVEGFERLHAGEPWSNEVCAGIGLAVPFYRPVGLARRVRCPLLVQAGTHDVLTPPGPARRVARSAPRGKLSEYPYGHFEFYFGEAFRETVAEQVAFLRRELARPG